MTVAEDGDEDVGVETEAEDVVVARSLPVVGVVVPSKAAGEAPIGGDSIGEDTEEAATGEDSEEAATGVGTVAGEIGDGAGVIVVDEVDVRLPRHTREFLSLTLDHPSFFADRSTGFDMSRT